MLVAVAVLAAAVVGAVAWWLRRDPDGGEGFAGLETEPRWGWELSLAPDARAAFMEGLRAHHESGGAVRVDGERGVLTTFDPPRLISLHLFADAFAARGDAAMHDPQGMVAELMEQIAGSERSGVLHLRAGWLEGEVDGLDAAGFLAATGEAVRPGAWSGEAGLGALQVIVPATRTSGEPGLSHVNGTPLKTVTTATTGADLAREPGTEPAGRTDADGATLLEADGVALLETSGIGTETTTGPGTAAGTAAGTGAGADGVAGGALRAGADGEAGAQAGTDTVAGSGADDAVSPGSEAVAAMAAEAGAEAGTSPEAGTPEAEPRAEAGTKARSGTGAQQGRVESGAKAGAAGIGAGEPNTMMVDLARVLDRYQEAREKRPDAAAEALLREVLPRLIASGGPGLTWTRPPTAAELRTVLGDSRE
ncbi:hypothetical protein ACIBI7_34500 [Nonomuraea fuscirosea]|uniref:hypothetical protein n=1 Tax=Nonomuraea fuscirosea TaxID=1291556 RepID=UPI0037A24B8A